MVGHFGRRVRRSYPRAPLLHRMIQTCRRLVRHWRARYLAGTRRAACTRRSCSCPWRTRRRSHRCKAKQYADLRRVFIQELYNQVSTDITSLVQGFWRISNHFEAKY